MPPLRIFIVVSYLMRCADGVSLTPRIVINIDGLVRQMIRLSTDDRIWFLS